MVKKSAPKSQKSKPTDMPGSIKDSAQQIWQAGLAAFTRAQAEGSKAFETLVKEGVGIQRKTQSAAEEKIAEATTKVSSMATDISSKASGQWDKLETIFEERVAKALNKLGVPSAKDVKELTARIDVLSAEVKKLSQQSAQKSTAKVAPKTAAKAPTKAPAKKAAPLAATKPVASKTSKAKATSTKSTVAKRVAA